MLNIRISYNLVIRTLHYIPCFMVYLMLNINYATVIDWENYIDGAFLSLRSNYFIIYLRPDSCIL